MFSPRYKARHRVDEDLAAEMEMRRRIRAHLRENHPDNPEPPGGGWRFVLVDWPCIFCPEFLLRVRVPTVDIPALAYCPSCKRVYEGDMGN